jgi:hypothetical protein
MGRICSCSAIKEGNNFLSHDEYNDFRLLIKNEISLGDLEEIKYKPDFAKGKSYSGDWYRCAKCGVVWRLVEPSNSSKGFWGKIDI